MAIEESIRAQITARPEPATLVWTLRHATESDHRNTNAAEPSMASVTVFKIHGSADVGMRDARPRLCGDAIVAVVQAADFWHGDNASG